MKQKRKLKIVFASHSAMAGPFVVGSHHLARRFSGMGHRVLHLSTPLTIFHLAKLLDESPRERLRLWSSGGIERHGDLIEYVPLSMIPWQIARHAMPARNLFLACIPNLRRKLASLGFQHADLLLIDQPKMQGLEGMVSAGAVVYRATDLYPEITGDPLVALAEEMLVRKADLVVGTSQPVLNHLRTLGNPRRELLLENGVDVAHFSTPRPAPSEYEGIAGPIAVYAGALDERFDLDLIKYLCAKLPSLRVMLIGPVSTEARRVVEGIPNATLLGPRRFEVLPAFLQHARIGLLPLSAHPANAGRSPMKLYEYGASGLPIVSSWTPALAHSEKPFVELAKTPEDFVQTVKAILADKVRYEFMRRSGLEAAQRMNWDGIAERLLSEVHSLLDLSNGCNGQERN